MEVNVLNAETQTQTYVNKTHQLKASHSSQRNRATLKITVCGNAVYVKAAQLFHQQSHQRT